MNLWSAGGGFLDDNFKGPDHQMAHTCPGILGSQSPSFKNLRTLVNTWGSLPPPSATLKLLLMVSVIGIASHGLLYTPNEVKPTARPLGVAVEPGLGI